MLEVRRAYSTQIMRQLKSKPPDRVREKRVKRWKGGAWDGMLRRNPAA